MYLDFKKRKYFAALAAAVCVIMLLTAAFFTRIKEVDIEGNEKLSGEELSARIFSSDMDSISAVCFLKEKFSKHPSIPFVESYSLKFVSPVHVRITVYEKNTVGCVRYMDSYLYFDKGGQVVESQDRRLPGVALVTGLMFDRVVLYEKLELKGGQDFDDIVFLAQLLSEKGIETEQVHFDGRGNVSIRTGNQTVVLGDTENLEGKINEYIDIRRVLKDRPGTLYLDNFDDAVTQAGYSFIPDGS